MPAWVRSALTTFLTTLLSLIPVAAIVDGDFTWAGAAITAAVIAGAREVARPLLRDLLVPLVSPEAVVDHQRSSSSRRSRSDF